jgi:hypothetical protein
MDSAGLSGRDLQPHPVGRATQLEGAGTTRSSPVAEVSARAGRGTSSRAEFRWPEPQISGFGAPKSTRRSCASVPPD